MRTAAAIEDSRADASPAHRCIGSSRQWSFRCPHNAPSIAPFLSPNNRNRLAILILTHANPFSMTRRQFWSLAPESHHRQAILNRLAVEC
jgi:hypothetical protein